MKRRKLYVFFYFYATIYLILYIRYITDDLIDNNNRIQKSSIFDEIDYYKKLFPIRYALQFIEKYDNMPTIYIITPTYTRPTQMGDLTRLKNTLSLIPKIVWIIVEDSLTKTDKVTTFVYESNLEIIHLNEKTMSLSPQKFRMVHRGVEQRNRALEWIKENKPENAIVYFADDDNSYDLRLFEEIRSVKKIGVWPVGLVGGLMYEKPLCKDDKLVGWFFAYNPTRYFPTDMASFAIDVSLLYDIKDTYFERITKGDLEGVFLKKLKIQMKDLEPKAECCSKIYVWHTKTKPVHMKPWISPDKEIMAQI